VAYSAATASAEQPASPSARCLAGRPDLYWSRLSGPLRNVDAAAAIVEAEGRDATAKLAAR
jgi:hypothetical protein